MSGTRSFAAPRTHRVLCTCNRVRRASSPAVGHKPVLLAHAAVALQTPRRQSYPSPLLRHAHIPTCYRWVELMFFVGFIIAVILEKLQG